MLFVASAVKLVAEIALMALAGRFLLAILAGERRRSNLFYQLLDILTSPFVKGTRLLTPRVVLDRHIPLAAFLLLSMVWLAATITKVSLCIQIGVEQCR